MAPIPSTPASKATEDQKVAFNKAVTEAFRELRQWTESHGPLHREKGANMLSGVDMVDHSDPLRSLSRLGVIGIAVEKLKQLDRLLESVSRQPVGKLDLVPGYSPPTEGLGAKPEPSAGVSPQAGYAVQTGQAAPTEQAVQTGQAAQTGTSKQEAIVITDSAERSQPPNPILVSGDYLFRLERENHLLRTHLVHFERGIVGRLENGLKQIGRRYSSSTPTASNLQGGHAGKEGTARVQVEDTATQTGNSGQSAAAAPSRKRSLKLILKVTPTLLEGVGDGQESGSKKQRVAGRKRAREASDETVVRLKDTPGAFEGAKGGTMKSRKLE
jgi:hypothetical protein